MTEEQRGEGPVPVRDLMRPQVDAPEDAGHPGWEGREHEFEMDGVQWTVRPAGAGAYGTGPRGRARILAVHFFREGEPDPVREALVPAGVFPHLLAGELPVLYRRATPIELDRD